MTSQSETGHAKNVATFNSLVSFCQGYGNTYNPGLAAIQLSSLQTLATTAQAALEDCKSKQLDFDQAVDARLMAFAALRPRAQKMMYALRATAATEVTIDGAMVLYRKIQGRRKVAKDEAAGAPDAGTGSDPAGGHSGDLNAKEQKYISVSQLSFDNVLANFSALVELLSKVSQYQPNETELKVASLKNYVAELKLANQTVINLYTAWSNLRISRNQLLYGASSGMVVLAGQVKNYVKSIYGLQSPQYKHLIGLQFTNGKM